LGELSSGIAHEIRNPLGIIKTVVQTMDYDVMDGEAKESLGVILEEVERANKVIEELLDFARNREFIFESYLLDKLLDEVIRLTDKYMKTHNVKLKFHGDELGYINADISRLKQVFINIIFNAVQAMPNGGKLYMAAKVYSSSHISISVMHTGGGMPDRIRRQIFTPLFTTKPGGQGFGLAVCKRVIEAHGGTISFESAEGKGSRFTVEFPSA
jgi:signal transduction histidine kinase